MCGFGLVQDIEIFDDAEQKVEVRPKSSYELEAYVGLEYIRLEDVFWFRYRYIYFIVDERKEYFFICFFGVGGNDLAHFIGKQLSDLNFWCGVGGEALFESFILNEVVYVHSLHGGDAANGTREVLDAVAGQDEYFASNWILKGCVQKHPFKHLEKASPNFRAFIYKEFAELEVYRADAPLDVIFAVVDGGLRYKYPAAQKNGLRNSGFGLVGEGAVIDAVVDEVENEVYHLGLELFDKGPNAVKQVRRINAEE